jgi:hypothetical protein
VVAGEIAEHRDHDEHRHDYRANASRGEIHAQPELSNDTPPPPERLLGAGALLVGRSGAFAGGAATGAVLVATGAEEVTVAGVCSTAAAAGCRLAVTLRRVDGFTCATTAPGRIAGAALRLTGRSSPVCAAAMRGSVPWPAGLAELSTRPTTNESENSTAQAAIRSSAARSKSGERRAPTSTQRLGARTLFMSSDTPSA